MRNIDLLGDHIARTTLKAGRRNKRREDRILGPIAWFYLILLGMLLGMTLGKML